ncbi:carbohydrate ABC transporter permease [Paenibacillus xylanilyticus]|uniref:Sugar ABC transporter permease n=1 Tax=Paenibacillus xylanilyticus TaxID=248903 RepID=A0A7Y6EXD4_9BACL|nr:sugar ABC transporter permease [Paenibacillus xylanilyticus]NUU77678.1 sugar ABC transporter permease [Paenibacillus xylanilyticus]
MRTTGVIPSRPKRRSFSERGLRKFNYRQKRLLFIYGGLLLPLLYFVVVRILPILYSFNVSFREWGMLSPDKPFVGLDNYTTLLSDSLFLKALLNTGIYVVVGVPAQLIAGLVVALLLQQVVKLRGLFRTAYFIPYVTSVVAVSWVFRWLLMKNGIVNSLFIEAGLGPQSFLYSPSQAIFWIVAVMVWQNIGFQMLIFLAGLENIPKMYYEAASIDGAAAWQRFVHITLPLINPVMLLSVVMASIGFLQSFTQVLNMTGGGPLDSTISVVLHIYNLAFKSFDMGMASAATVILFAIILMLTLIQLKILGSRYQQE